MFLFVPARWCLISVRNGASSRRWSQKLTRPSSLPVIKSSGRVGWVSTLVNTAVTCELKPPPNSMRTFAQSHTVDVRDTRGVSLTRTPSSRGTIGSQRYPKCAIDSQEQSCSQNIPHGKHSVQIQNADIDSTRKHLSYPTVATTESRPSTLTPLIARLLESLLTAFSKNGVTPLATGARTMHAIAKATTYRFSLRS